PCATADSNLRQQAGAHAGQGEFERFTRDARHEGADHPSQPGRNPATQRYRLALNVGAFRTLLQRAIVVEPPEKSTVAADGSFHFILRAGMLQLGDPRAVAANVGPDGIEPAVVYVVLRVQHDGDDLLHEKLEVNLEPIAVAVQDRPLADIRCVDVAV